MITCVRRPRNRIDLGGWFPWVTLRGNFAPQMCQEKFQILNPKMNVSKMPNQNAEKEKDLSLSVSFLCQVAHELSWESFAKALEGFRMSIRCTPGSSNAMVAWHLQLVLLPSNLWKWKKLTKTKKVGQQKRHIDQYGNKIAKKKVEHVELKIWLLSDDGWSCSRPIWEEENMVPPFRRWWWNSPTSFGQTLALTHPLQRWQTGSPYVNMRCHRRPCHALVLGLCD